MFHSKIFLLGAISLVIYFILYVNAHLYFNKEEPNHQKLLHRNQPSWCKGLNMKITDILIRLINLTLKVFNAKLLEEDFRLSSTSSKCFTKNVLIRALIV